MAATQDFPHRPVQQLLTGHFHETFGYRVHRPGGVGDWLLIQTIDGSGRFGHGNGDILTGPNDLALLRPHTLHDYAVAHPGTHWELLWAHFQPRADWLGLLDWPEVAPGLMLLSPTDPAIAAKFFEVHRLFHGEFRRREAYALNALEALLLDCDRLNPRPADHRDERIVRATQILDRNFATKVTLDDLADRIGLSSSRLAHLFRDVTGQTVQRYLEARRMQHAVELLNRTGFSVQHIAHASGFESPFYFSQRFKRWTGMSPAVFRGSGPTRPGSRPMRGSP
jgi:AraC family transcriptional regulator of arabinose operon